MSGNINLFTYFSVYELYKPKKLKKLNKKSGKDTIITHPVLNYNSN